MEHLALEVFDRDGGGSKYAFLPDDTSITITETSEIFDSGDIWSHAFTLNIPANAHIFGTAGEMHGSRLHEQIDKRRARLWVEGLPLYYGYLHLDDEVEVDANGDIDISFESGRKTFKDMVEGIKANQVPVKDDVLIGMALDRERTLHRNSVLRVDYASPFGGAYNWSEEYEVVLDGPENFAQKYPKIVKPDGEWYQNPFDPESYQYFKLEKKSTVNTDVPYDAAHPYCNVRLCYTKQAYVDNNGSLEKKAVRDYRIAEARRINPAPCFYVMYWLDCLMSHLGVHVNENQMTSIEDLKRLFFLNTKCAYKTKGDKWSDYHGLPFAAKSPFIPIPLEDDPAWKFDLNVTNDSSIWYSCTFKDVGEWQGIEEMLVQKWMKAYATSENFPDVNIDDVISAIENGFGVRLLFDKSYTKVRIVLLRNVLRSQEVHKVTCEVTEQPVKVDNSIRGFRLTYGGSDDNTDYVYKGFVLAKQKSDGGWITEEDEHDYSQWDMTLHYNDIRGKVGMLNKTCYIDMYTGDAYIVKIDENYKKASDEAFPSLFSCADFMDAEDGDCSGEDETIKEIRVGFSPIIMNVMGDGISYAYFVGKEMGVPPDDSIRLDMSDEEISALYQDTSRLDIGEAGTSAAKDTVPCQSGLFEVATATTFVARKRNPSPGEDPETFLHHGTVSLKISGWVREGYRLYLEDNYEINDAMESPLESAETGLTLGIMRGSGYDAQISYTNDLTENEGNEAWELVPGSGSFAHSDTCNDSGIIWDYGGTYGYNAVCTTAADAIEAMRAIWGPKAHNFSITTLSQTTYLTGVHTPSIEDNEGVQHVIMLAGATKNMGTILSSDLLQHYIDKLRGKSIATMLAIDRQNLGIIIETDSSYEKGQTLLALQKLAYDNGEAVIVSGGVDVREGRLSLKLRAEKPNPFFDPRQPENDTTNRRYLEITNRNLRQRGIADRLYKEYSYWVRNAKIAKMKVHIGMAELLAIDKTVRQSICDIMGFVKKMQYRVSKQSGLSDVEMEVWYL